MRKLSMSLRFSLLFLLGCLFILLAGCASKNTEIDPQATTTDTTTSTSMSVEPSTGSMTTDTAMGTMSTDTGMGMGTDMTTSSPMGSDTTMPPQEEEYPEFPWPPPEASASVVIPRQFLASATGTTILSDVDRRLVNVLERNGYFESSYYAVPGGFALVTKMEQINAAGESKDRATRWIIERQPLQKFSLNEYLRALFSAAPGRYRVIVFIVTPHPFSQSEATVTSREASRWLGKGVDQLPGTIGRLNFERLKCTALIYEFARTSDVADPMLRKPSSLQGRTHLEMAGIWRGLAK